MRELRYREALREALAEEMERDPNVFIVGEEVGYYQGASKVTEGLLDRFGANLSRRGSDSAYPQAGAKLKQLHTITDKR